MAKQLELRRHTDDDGDALSEEGVRNALDIGATLTGGYAVIYTSGAQRATQTAACFLAAGCGGVDRGVHVDTGLRSQHEDRWKEAYSEAGSGELSAFREVASDFVEEESRTLADTLRRILDDLDDGERALCIGHSPTIEAAVAGLTGEDVDPVGKGDGVLVVEDGETFTVERLEA